MGCDIGSVPSRGKGILGQRGEEVPPPTHTHPRTGTSKTHWEGSQTETEGERERGGGVIPEVQRGDSSEWSC